MRGGEDLGVLARGEGRGLVVHGFFGGGGVVDFRRGRCHAKSKRERERRYLQMPIHNPAPPKPILEKMYHAPLRPRHDIHQCFFVPDLRVGAMIFVAELFRARELRGQFLEALSPIWGQRRVGVGVEGVEEGIFVV